MDDIRIDSHKLMYHPERVASWLKGKNIYPICIEVGPSGRCNHRCIFCAFNYLEYQGTFIDRGALISFLQQAATLGIKSIVYSGQGEPLLHENIVELIKETKRLGLDVALSTNGVFFDETTALESLPLLTWLRFSLDAATKETYAKVHQCRPSDFDTVIQNITNAVKIKRERGCTCTIGVQFLLLPENQHETIQSAAMMRDIGADYLTIKPFSKHPMSSITIDKAIYSKDLPERELQQFASENFRVIFRWHTIEKLQENKPYERCLGLPFMTDIDDRGDMYTCNAFLGDKNFCYGNIYQKSFSEIWGGQQRKDVLDRIAKMGISQCRENCRLDEINRYLWSLKYRQIPHVNFS